MSDALISDLLNAAKIHSLESVQSPGAPEITMHVGALMKGMVASELEKETMLGVPIRSRDEKTIKKNVLPQLRSYLDEWREYVESTYGADGLSFLAAIAEDQDFFFRGASPREGKDRYKLGEARATPVPDDAVVEEAVDAGAVRLRWQGERIIGARVGATYEYGECQEALERLLPLPACKELRAITLGMWTDGGQNEYMDAIDAMAAHGPYPTLNKLVVGDFEFPDDTELSWTDIGDLGALWPLMPALEELRIQGCGIGLGAFALPALRSLEIISAGLPQGAAKSLAAMKCPKVETLELWFGDPERGGAGAEPFDGFFDLDLPQLRRLRLKNATFTDAVAKALERASFLPRLEIIDLSMGTLTDAGAEELQKLAPRCAALKVLNIDANFVGSDHVGALRESFGGKLAAGTQRDAGESDGDHYVAISE